MFAVGSRGGGRRLLGREQAGRAVAERDGGDFLDARHRNQDQRHQQDDAQRQRERRSENEVMRVPVSENRRDPGADDIGGGGQDECLRRCRGGSESRMPTRTAMVASFQ